MWKGFSPLVVPGTLILLTLSSMAGCRATSDSFASRLSNRLSNRLPGKLFSRKNAEIQTVQAEQPAAPSEELSAADVVYASSEEAEEGGAVDAESSEEFLFAEEDLFSDEAPVGEFADEQTVSDKRERHYLALLDENPDNAATWNDFGVYYSSQELWEPAADALEKAVALDPERNLYRNNLAAALVRAGHVADGLSEFTHSVGAAAAHYNVGYLLMQEGSEAESAQQFLLALMKDPDLEEASYWLDVLADQGVFSDSVANRETEQIERK